MSRYVTLMKENVVRAFARSGIDMAGAMGARPEGGTLVFTAFGRNCRVSAAGLKLAGGEPEDPLGLLISLYALYAREQPMRLTPMQAFKDLPGSMPYHGAFHANTEQILLPHVPALQAHRGELTAHFGGSPEVPEAGGDFSFIIQPLPKIALGYIFYLADEDFPPSVTCLFSSNALSFMPLDGLADLAEYSSRGMIALLETRPTPAP